MIKKIKAGDLLFTYNKKSILSKAINFFSKLGVTKPKIRISHVAIYIGNDLIIEADKKGVEVNSIHKYDDKFNLYTGKVRGFKYNSDFKKSCINDVGRIKYAYFQVVIMMVKKIFGLNTTKDSDRKKVICSEYVVDKYRKFGIDLFRKVDSWEITPLDIYKRVTR